MSTTTSITILFSLLLSLLLSTHTTAQTPAPTMVSATLDSVGQTVSIIFTSPSSTCSSMICWFNLYHDNDASGFIDYFPLSTTSTYYATVNVNNSAIPNGMHTFFVTQSAIPGSDSAWSNQVSVNVQQPQANPQGILTPSLPAVIAGDPQFTGLRGQSYQVHGVPNEVFSIVSDVDLQYNSRFVLLTQGQCPRDETGKVVDTPCFTHPGTYLGELGLETAAGDKLYIQAGTATGGFEQIQLNGEELLIGEHHMLQPLEGRQQGYVRLVSSHRVVVQAGNFWFEFTNSDVFVNQRVAMLDPEQQTSHGLLGQTWSTAIYDVSSSIPWIEGSVFDYAMADHKLFSHRFVFNQFQSATATTPAADDEDQHDHSEAESEEDADDEEVEEAMLLERLKRITAARARATGTLKPSAGKHAHSHAHGRSWELQ